MFHHFHNNIHPRSQGSLSDKDFTELLLWLHKKYNLIGAKEYSKKLWSGTLSASDVCLSFDDALKCQYDIAIPILEKFGLDAFFFVYSSIFSDSPDLLEIYRFFRNIHFAEIDIFYNDFFAIVEQLDTVEYKKQKFAYKSMNYLSAFPFYSENDKWFRYIRDQYLVPIRYKEIMSKMMFQHGFNIEDAKKNIWMSEDDLKDIDRMQHVIGLHTFSHPTQTSKLSFKDQYREYSKNYEHLSVLLDHPIQSMSYPCGDYNDDTLKILKSMGISIGFRSSMSVNEIKSSLEIPREDHSNVLKEMKLSK